MKFEKPEMEKIEFEAEDVIITSGCDPVCSPDCKEVRCDTFGNSPAYDNPLS